MAIIVPLVLVMLARLAGFVAMHRAHEQIYTVSALQQGLASHPAAWIGHDVLVRGTFVTADEWQSPTSIAEFCDSNSDWCPLIAPDGHNVHLTFNGTTQRTRGAVLWQTASPPGFLLLRSRLTPAPWLQFLHNLPVLGRLVTLPTPHTRGKVVQVVRIRILAPHSSCQGTRWTGGLPCDDAVLLAT